MIRCSVNTESLDLARNHLSEIGLERFAVALVVVVRALHQSFLGLRLANTCFAVDDEQIDPLGEGAIRALWIVVEIGLALGFA
jgi:hypothetical protein